MTWIQWSIQQSTVNHSVMKYLKTATGQMRGISEHLHLSEAPYQMNKQLKNWLYRPDTQNTSWNSFES